MSQLSIFHSDNPEDENIEYKTASKGTLPKDIWEVVTAFSNAEGGKVVFGVGPDGNLKPLTPTERDLLQRNILTNCTGAYSMKINPAISSDGATVTAYIPPAPAALRPVYSRKHGLPLGAKVRVGSSNVQVDEEWMAKFSIAARGGAESLTYSGSVDDLLDAEAIDEYIVRLNTRRGGVYSKYSREECMVKLNIVTKAGDITLFGLLAFSRDAALQDTVSPTLTIAVTQYPGTTKLSGGGAETYIDNREFYGPVRKQYEESLLFLLSKIPIRGVIKSGSGMRKDEYLIPYNAVREALANTIAHRDYSVLSSRIHVDIYADRIEFINPGRSLVPIKELDTAPSMTRNPLLMNYLREIGATEQLARGIRTIKYELRQAGLQEPTFANVSSSFVATIHHSAFVSLDDREWLRRFKEYRLNERQLAGITAAKSSIDGINNKEYRTVNGMNRMGDDKLANKDLKKLTDLEILRKVGEYKSTRYFVDDRFLD